MGKLDQYDKPDQYRITAIACGLIERQIAEGKIPFSKEAIQAAMPQAVEDARLTMNAVNEFLAG